MRMTDIKSQSVKDSENSKCSDAHESDSDKDDNVKDNPGQEFWETKPQVSLAERTVQTSVGPQREMEPRQSISILSDGAGCCEPQDSEKKQLDKLYGSLAQGCVYPQDLNRRLRDPSIPNNLFHSAQVNTWTSCATMDQAVPCGLSLAAAVRTPETSGFSVGLQQHAPDLLSLSHFGGFLFYPYSSFPAASAEYLIPPVVHSWDYFTSPMMLSSVPALGGGGLRYFAPDLLMLAKTDQKTSVDEAEIDCNQDESQTG
ncbi:uncharacterized protein LOC115013724 isoform X2 [Cottoperca gobio]|uniref:Uncharacterized protein LOC115013724 isoform X2 n=1 Tax=Cottoperca gobio TaxID=56716 RepID=A0A6J2QCA1_COTGO|nr:uncharacterized protein LOC115013724 isoform X2 [Cottoperca gobio]